MKTRLLLSFAVGVAAIPISAKPNLHAEIFGAVRAFETKGHGLSPSATLEFPDLATSDPSRMRLWKDVPNGSSSVTYRERVLRMKIVAATSDHAIAEAKVRSDTFVSGRTLDGSPKFEGSTLFCDQVELHRNSRRWEITAVVRSFRCL